MNPATTHSEFNKETPRRHFLGNQQRQNVRENKFRVRMLSVSNYKAEKGMLLTRGNRVEMVEKEVQLKYKEFKKKTARIKRKYEKFFKSVKKWCFDQRNTRKN